jgi:aromatic ring-opening dioxygenase catalytic subunit (LigB family)
MGKPSKMPVYFLSHGGGPWPWMRQQMPGVWDKLDASLKAIPASLSSRPGALLVITSHWREKEFVISSGSKPAMIYDFGGFPAHTYQVQYPADGSPELASRILQLLTSAGLPSRLDATRGFDHGTYTVTYPMYPDAEIPVVQISIQKRYDPMLHIELGRALSILRDEGVLILGSGLSFHNLGLFGEEAKSPSDAFDQWLRDTVLNQSGEIRMRSLLNWSSAPSARIAHPREDHLIPLMVTIGAAESEPAQLIYHENMVFGGWTVSGFRIG